MANPCHGSNGGRSALPRLAAGAARTLVAGLASVLAVSAGAGPDAPAADGRLALPLAEVVGRPAPYADFCRRHPEQCDLSGDGVVEHDPRLMATLASVNAAVNREVRFVLDKLQHNAEEYWALPASGRGDCEDEALEKRRRLAALGLPRGALRLALVMHRKRLSAHAVLTVETSRGTYILDSLTDEVLRWNRTPYNFEARERPDGRWERFDQTEWTWSFEP